MYNIPKFDGFHKRQHPPVLSDHIDEIEDFSRVSSSLLLLVPPALPQS